MDQINLSSGYSKLTANLQDNKAINTVHISSHSLKSQSQVMGFTDIANLCFEIEKISKDILGGIRKNDDAFMALLKRTVDELNLGINSIQKGNAETSSA